MSMCRVPQVGDWVVATSEIGARVSLISSRRLPVGTRGVVTTAVHGWWQPRVGVRFDAGLSGIVECDAEVARLRVVRRGGGHDAFVRRAQIGGAARAGVAVALLAPLVYFVVAYVWTRRTVEGLTGAVLGAVIDSAVGTAGSAITHPVTTAMFLLVGGVLARFAFRR